MNITTSIVRPYVNEEFLIKLGNEKPLSFGNETEISVNVNDGFVSCKNEEEEQRTFKYNVHSNTTKVNIVEIDVNQVTGETRMYGLDFHSEIINMDRGVCHLQVKFVSKNYHKYTSKFVN